MPAARIAGRAVLVAKATLGDAPGASKGFFVVTLGGEEYLVKAKSRCDGVGPFIPANELIGIELAHAVGLPVFAWDPIDVGQGEIAFGARRMLNAAFGNLNTKMIAQLADVTFLDAIAVFDLWISNTDRHRGNLLCRRVPKIGYQVLAADHSHAIVREHTDPTKLREFAAGVPPAHFFHCDELRSAVSDSARFREALDMIENFPEATLRETIGMVPSEWMAHDIQSEVGDFLIERARNIRALLANVQHVFPKLNGVVI